MHTTLISAAQLSPQADNPNWVIVDCRHDLANLAAGREGYAIAHLPNALFADMETELSGVKRGEDGVFRGRHPLPERADLLATLRRWGINDESQVVAYDAHGGMFAARLWWMLRWMGHKGVAVLDGGMAAWQSAGLPLTTLVPERPAGHIHDRAPLVETVNAEQVLANVTSALRIVVDARAPDRFRGENETIDPVGGHIPGARNRFFKDNLREDGRFKDAQDLRADYALLIHEPADAILQCGSGVTACHNLLAMEVAGLPGAALYPGSWSEWCADPARPVATGA